MGKANPFEERLFKLKRANREITAKWRRAQKRIRELEHMLGLTGEDEPESPPPDPVIKLPRCGCGSEMVKIEMGIHTLLMCKDDKCGKKKHLKNGVAKDVV